MRTKKIGLLALISKKSAYIVISTMVCMVLALPQGANGEERFIVGFASSAGSYTNGIGETQTAVTHPGNGTSNAPSVVVNGYAAYDITLNTSNAYTASSQQYDYNSWSYVTTYPFCNQYGIAIAGSTTTAYSLTYTAPTGVYFSTKTHFLPLGYSGSATRYAYFAYNTAADGTGTTVNANQLYTNAKITKAGNNNYTGWWGPITSPVNSFYISAKNSRNNSTTAVLYQSWFYFLIPEVKAASMQEYGEPRGLYDLGQLEKNITTGTQTITIKVADGVNASDFNAVITNKSVGSFSTVNKSLNAAGTELTLTFTYSSGNTDGAINAELLVTSVNTLDTKSYTIDITGTVGNAKAFNPLAWNIDAAQSIFSEYTLAEYLTNIVSPEAISVSVTGGTASVVEISGTNIRFKEAGTVQLTVVQPEGDDYEGASLPMTFTVSKRTATFDFSETTLFVNTTYPNLITCPQDVNGTLMPLLNYSGASSYMTVDGSGNVTTLGNASNSVTLTITFAGNAEWNPINATQTFKIVHPLPQPEFCLSGLDDITTRAVDGVFIQQEGSNGSYTWTGSALQLVSPNSISYWSECTFVVIHFDGIPNQLRFTPSARTYIEVDESADGEIWTNLYQQRPSNTNQMTYTLNSTTRYVRIGVGRYSNTTTCVLNNLCITSQPSFTASPATVTVYTDGITSTPATITLTHNDMTSISVTSIDSKLQAGSFSVVSGEAIGANNKGTVSFDVNYKVPDANPGTSRSTTLTLTGNKNGGGTVTQNVTVNIEVVHATHYAKAIAEVASETGTGQVYVGKTGDEPASNQYRFTHSATQACSGEMGEDDDLTFWYWSKAAEGFELEGWYADPEMTESVSAQEHFSTTVHAASTDVNAPTTRTIYANFVESEPQDKPKFTIENLDLGTMQSGDGVGLNGNLVLQPEGEAIRPLYIDPEQTTISFTGADAQYFHCEAGYAKGSKSFAITFYPTCATPTTKVYTATATVSATNIFGTTTKQVTVTATVTPADMATFSVPATLSFADTYRYLTDVKNLTLSSITNMKAGTTPTITITGANAGFFSAGAYNAGSFPITFAPTDWGVKTATATVSVVNYDNVATTHDVTLTGECIHAPDAAFTVDASHNFGSLYRNQTATWEAELTGISNALGDPTITISGAACITMSAYNSTTHKFTVTFAPTAWNNYASTITITMVNYDGKETTQTIALTGVCVEAPAADFTIGDASFEDTQRNETDVKTLTITGISNAYGNPTITKVSGDACITLNNDYNSTTHQFTATFAPTVWGTYSATISVSFDNYDGVTTTKTFVLSGECVHAPKASFDVTATSYTYASIERGQTDSWTVTLSNITNASATVPPTMTIAGTDYAYFVASDYDAVNKQFTITFEPMAVGGPYEATATILMLNNDGDETTKTINLTGTCVAAPDANFDIQDAATSGTSVVGTTVYFGDFDPAEGNVLTFYIVNPENVKEGTVPSIEMATASNFVKSDYNEGTESFTITFTATDAMNGMQNGNVSVSMINNEGKKTTKSFLISASIKDHAEYDVEVTDSEGKLLPNGHTTWALGLVLANSNAGSTLKLLRDVDLTGTYGITSTQGITQTITLDLNGKTLSGAIGGAILNPSKSGKMLTIKDSKTGGKIQNIADLNGTLYAINVSAGVTLNVESGYIYVENQSQYAYGTSTYTDGTPNISSMQARAIHMAATSTVNISGGKIHAVASRNAFGIREESSKANNTVLTITGGEIIGEAPAYAYGIYASGKVNISGGTVTALLNDKTVDGNTTYTANAWNDYTLHRYGYGIQMFASSNATAANCYFGTLTITGGTVNAINVNKTLNSSSAVQTEHTYGIYMNVSATGAGAGKTAPDGSKVMKACAIGSIENATINVTHAGSTAYGVMAVGCYNSFDNSTTPLQIKNTTINVESFASAYGVYANAYVNWSSTLANHTGNGGCTAGEVELTNTTINATTTGGAGAYCAWANATSGTVADAKATTGSQSTGNATYCGEYAAAGKITVNSGTYTANAATSSAYGIGSSDRAKTVRSIKGALIGRDAAVDPLGSLGGAAEAYPELNIHGGDFSATTGTTTAVAVKSGGNTLIDGGTFNAYSGTTTAYGLYVTAGKTVANGVTFPASATTVAYGVYVYGGISDWSLFPYYGEVELNNCNATATARTTTDARAVYVNGTTKVYTQASFDAMKTANNSNYKNYGDYAQVGERAFVGKATINGGTYSATAETTTAFGIYMMSTRVSTNKEAIAYNPLVVKNATIAAKTNTSTSAYGVSIGGGGLIENCTISATAGTTTASGVRAIDKTTVIKNSTISAKGTDVVYGLEGYVDASTAHGYCWHGDFDLSEAGTTKVTAESTGATKAYTIFLNAKAVNVASGNFAGDYATAANATINGGTYIAKTNGGTSGYTLALTGTQTKGTASAQPEVLIEGGKFNGATAEVGTAGVAGHVQLKGGYYVHNTNLSKYIPEGYEEFTLPNDRPEYAEGYRYAIEPVGNHGNYVCQIGSTKYKTLAEALQVVTSGQTIVMIANHTVAAGDYILPAGANLLVPYQSGQTSISTHPTVENAYTKPSCYLKLTFAKGAHLDVCGKIEASSKMAAKGQTNGTNGMPHIAYGWIYLSEGSTMTLETGSVLYAWGYVTGPGEIDAKRGSTVHEMFQITDWRGGTATGSFNGNSNKVFPINQYYIQNIESPIKFRPGSAELCDGGANASSTAIRIDDVKMIGVSGSGAFFEMNNSDVSEDTWVRKWYDTSTDQQVYEVNNSVNINSITLNINLRQISWLLGNYTFTSSSYVLPITNNMKIHLLNGTLNITQDTELTAGSILEIDKLATINIKSGVKLYVFDTDEWNAFSGTTKTYPVPYSPSWTTCPRSTSNVPDAAINVHGTLQVNGSLYTTAGGANIFSTNEDAGTITYASAVSSSQSSVYVANNTGPTYTERKSNPAWLKNGEGITPTYSETAGTAAGKTWTYYDDKWQCWSKDGCFFMDAQDNPYAKPAAYVELTSKTPDANHLHHDAATGARNFVWDKDCYWWEVSTTPTAEGYYLSLNADNNGKYNYYEYNSSGNYWQIKTITVTWNIEGSTTNYSVGYGTKPEWLGATPTKSSSSSDYVWRWDGWTKGSDATVLANNDLPFVTENTTFTAHFYEKYYEYNITFKNDDGTVLDSRNWRKGITPSYEGTPTKTSTAEWEYKFKGTWSPAIATVTSAAEYVAQYTQTKRKYDVQFLNWDNTEVETKEVEYGTIPTTPDPNPTRIDPSDTYLYDFVGWRLNGAESNGLVSVTGNQIYVAQYTSRPKYFTIRFVDWNGRMIQSDDVLNGAAVTPPAEPTRENDAQYDYAFTGWDPAVTNATANQTYTAQYGSSLHSYTIRFLDYDETVLQSETLPYGSTPSYAGTPTRPNSAEYSYTFAGWNDIIREVTGAKDYTAQYIEVLLDEGTYMDITDVVNTDNTKGTLTINITGWPSAGWPYTVNGNTYAKTIDWEADRTMIIPYTGAPGDEFLITVKNKNGGLYSQHKYIIPLEVKSNSNISELSATDKPIYVKPNVTLTVNSSTQVRNIYVAPDAKLIINNGLKLSADTLFLRTTPWASAELENNGTINANQVCYTRIIKKKDKYYQFGLPFKSDISIVTLSDGRKPNYGNGWLLRSYSERNRALYGATGENWETLFEKDKVIQATVGYEMFSNSGYYREYYFPVVMDTRSNSIPISYTSDAKAVTKGEEHEGWNIVVSPLTKRYEVEPQPEGWTVCWLQPDGSYVQEPANSIRPAIPFSYQTKTSGYITFGTEITIPTLAPRHRVSAMEEPERIQWIHLDIKAANGIGDQTSIYSHPTRYEETYKTGIDVAKQSFEATRALLYSSHAYGEMAFAGVSDSLLEQGIPLSVYSPAEQRLTLSMRENDWLNRLAYVWLIDNETGARTDLLWSDYSFLAQEGTTAGRFVIMGRFFAPEVATGIINAQGGDAESIKARKVMMDGKMYILINGRTYDATGKLVTNDK